MASIGIQRRNDHRRAPRPSLHRPAPVPGGAAGGEGDGATATGGGGDEEMAEGAFGPIDNSDHLREMHRFHSPMKIAETTPEERAEIAARYPQFREDVSGGEGGPRHGMYWYWSGDPLTPAHGKVTVYPTSAAWVSGRSLHGYIKQQGCSPDLESAFVRASALLCAAESEEATP